MLYSRYFYYLCQLTQTVEEGTPRKKVKGKRSKSGGAYDLDALLKYDGPRIEGLSFKVYISLTKLIVATRRRDIGSRTNISNQSARYRCFSTE